MGTVPFRVDHTKYYFTSSRDAHEYFFEHQHEAIGYPHAHWSVGGTILYWTIEHH